jgi:hypothetical protein
MIPPLPHLQHFEDTTVEDVFIKCCDAGDEQYLAVSHGFWELEDREQFESVFAAFREYFAKTVDAFSFVCGSPQFRGRWDHDSFPNWAQGYEIAVWTTTQPQVYLRLEHEDRELPIIIALAKVPT